ncbi:MAG: hypothetical protein OXI80_21370 [Caldilineaceae bacterium]|nr:hypothetical protein [Caldilineaceae bacterium]
MALKWKRYAWPELSRRQFGICHSVVLWWWRRPGYSSLANIAVTNILTAVFVCSTAAFVRSTAAFVRSTAAFVRLTALLVSAISSDKRSSFLSNRSWFSTTVSRPASILFSLASINVSRVEVATLFLAFPITAPAALYVFLHFVLPFSLERNTLHYHSHLNYCVKAGDTKTSVFDLRPVLAYD